MARRKYAGMPPRDAARGKYGVNLVRRDDYLTNPSLAKTENAGNLLSGLSSLLAFAPFPGARPLAAGVALTGAGLAAAPFFGPEATEEAIIDREKTKGGKFKVGYLGKLYDFFDGEGGRFSQEELKKTERAGIVRDIKDSPGYQEAAGLLSASDYQILPSDTSASAYTARLAPKVRAARRKEEFTSPENEYIRSMFEYRDTRDFNERSDRARREFRLENRALDNQQLQIQGGIDNTQFQLAIAQDANKERMHLYAQDLAAKRENDRYKTTVGLIQGLSALGTAFAL